MKIFAISDLHLSTACQKPMDIFGKLWENYIEKITADWESKVCDNDIVLIAGDISWAMNLEQAKADLDFIASLKGKKVIIKGNHDYWWSSLSKVKSILPNNMYLLQNNAIRFGDYIITGSRGWLTEESGELSLKDKKIYEREALRLELSLKEMQKIRKESDKIIAMMHYPPFTVKRDGTKFSRLFNDYKVDSVVYGHLHGKDCRADKLVELLGVKYYLTSCDLVDNKLIQIY